MYLLATFAAVLNTWCWCLAPSHSGPLELSLKPSGTSQELQLPTPALERSWNVLWEAFLSTLLPGYLIYTNLPGIYLVYTTPVTHRSYAWMPRSPHWTPKVVRLNLDHQFLKNETETFHSL